MYTYSMSDDHVKYEVLKHFSWGSLQLEPGQRLLFKKLNDDTASVSVYGDPKKSIMVNSVTILNQIEWERVRKA